MLSSRVNPTLGLPYYRLKVMKKLETYSLKMTLIQVQVQFVM